MLRQSFAHIPGIGQTTEMRLWQAGYEDWSAVLADIKKAPIGSADRDVVRQHLELGLQSLEDGNTAYFKKWLGIKDAWRAYSEFKESCVYLDIETDGGNSPSSISVIGLYGGGHYYGLIKDKDVDDFPDLLSQFKMIVTFFGDGFDIPMLKRRFKSTPFDQVHLDLCPLMKRLGYQGGLKRIERTLGIERAPETLGLTGYDAIKLWNRYYHLDDERALEILVAYNREDVVNLETLAVHGYDKMRVQTLLATVEELEEKPTRTETPGIAERFTPSNSPTRRTLRKIASGRLTKPSTNAEFEFGADWRPAPGS